MKLIKIKTSVGEYMADITKEEFMNLLNSDSNMISVPLGKGTTYYGGEEYDDDSVVHFFKDNITVLSVTEHNLEKKPEINLSTVGTEQAS